jgi:hypothetical protein
MDALLRFFIASEAWLYLLIGLVGVVYIRKLIIAIQEWKGTVFGLERNNAQHRLSDAVSILALLMLLALGEFVLVSFVSPSLPGVQVLATPTLDVLGTIQPARVNNIENAVTETPGSTQTEPTLVEVQNSCTPGQVEFSNPVAGQEIKGKVTLSGTVNITNFGFYKYEFSQPGTTTWTTVQAGDMLRCPQTACINPNATSVPGDELGIWDTSQLVPGDYLLRLVVTDNQGMSLPACVISVRVLPDDTGE